ncbi:flagellar basal-body rod modification protein FlgD [Cribrihabitans marinus]|uniref:Basal-body rod modification protein FlgD n=1 Tax=Cribrihabitans marinus TaxID=1227549 RepID=A0A1H6Y3T0_9RHOB|nr:flagellar hook capping FlgD N-terminal domain-containing protein [Cribrihabitans marinus]GGH27944.1 basal-body rod modification protein FlgD [Cribrihabitans marinus]SEJ31780.1 flagellar basal-body rod modification protein FlgD [Cribrihabitans marinus]
MITEVNGTAGVIPATSGSQAPGTGQSKALTSDFETFLRMLTAQARNQDPLEPVDSSEYAAQLAQFSMVEQQVKTNEMLTDLVSGFTASDMARLSGWVGMEARALIPARFDGAPVSVETAVAPEADSARLVVRDDTGAVVDRIGLDPSATAVAWAGVDSDGHAFPAGLYTFSVESYLGKTVISDRSAATYNRIVEAQFDETGAVLIFEGGQAVRADLVTAIREPS